MPNLNGKVALITGAGSPGGLGRSMTQALVASGARVAAVDVDAAGLQAAERELDGVAGIVADVSTFDGANEAVRQAIDKLGGLHILINNAGINPRFDFWELPPDAWSKTMAVNLSGPFFMAKAAAPHLRQQGWGRIIGVTTSLDTMIATMPYGPAKAGHEAFMAVLARQLEGTGVTANVLVPGGAVDTAMTKGLYDDTRRLLQPDVMQTPTVWLASDESDGFHGQRIVARRWDDNLPIQQRLERCSAPIAWPQLGRPTDEK